MALQDLMGLTTFLEGEAREWMREFDREAKAFRKHREECKNGK